MTASPRALAIASSPPSEEREVVHGPTGCDPVICNDLPNEDGVLNHAPDGVQVDNS